jgi:hypothetical protein
MSAMTPFEMKIIELFHFADGRTVLVGPIEGNVKFIRPCKCELLVDGVPRSVIQIEGEMITDRGLPEGYRSISTRDAVSLDRQLLSTSECLLRSVPFPAMSDGSKDSVAALQDSAADATTR